jgi:Ca2+-binding EF-hand superfamily protein
MKCNVLEDINVAHNFVGVIMDKENIAEGADKEVLETFRRNPYEKLKKYVKSAGYRLIDLFKDFDKDGSETITTEEFTKGLEVCV